MEFWDAYDSKLNRLEGILLVRNEKIPAGMYHLVSDIILEHTDGTYLIMQRDPALEYGGMWEATAGGSALAGETAEECALRELYEETGIRADGAEEYTTGISEEFRCIFAEFRAVTDCDKNSVRLQPSETVSFRWVTKQELGEIRNSGLLTERSCSCIRNLLGK